MMSTRDGRGLFCGIRSRRGYFLLTSGIGICGFGPGTAGVAGSPGRTGAGVIVSGFVTGTGGAGLLQPVNPKTSRAMQVHAMGFMAASMLM
jgi:hypothetical protein